MPPKGDPSLLTERDQVFLVECIKNSKEKLTPDFELVAQLTQMSKKGAANKFRDIMKRFEAAGTTSNGNAAATTKTATKRAKPGASKKGPATAEVEDEDGEDENEEVEPPKKKADTAKTKAKVPAKPKGGAKKGVARKKAAVQSEEKAEEGSDDEVGEAVEVRDGVADVEDEVESV